MLLYLLNASLIWLLSAILYELLFRRETVHAWNRAYLLCTLALGFLLPLVRWQPTSTLNYEARPIGLAASEIASVKTSLLPAAEEAARMPREPAVDWLLLGWAAGAALSFGRLLWEAIRIVRLYRCGRTTRQPGFTLIETGRRHGPFSFFRCVFISDRADYSGEELRFVLQHEQRHVRLLHSLDMLALQILCCLLWAHPLLYWYRHRLRLIHEYQADAGARLQAATYGRFLVTQALLQTPPSLSHSLQQSPLKNRIKMLVRPQSAGLRLARYFLVLPLLAVLMLGCTRFESAMPRSQKGSLVYFNGNTIEMAPGTISEENKRLMAKNPRLRPADFEADSIPYKLNGAVIEQAGAWTVAPSFKGTGTPMEAVVRSMTAPLSKLPNGRYMLVVSDAVINEKGQLVYFEAAPVRRAFGAIETDPQTGQKVLSMRVVLDKDSAGAGKANASRPGLDAEVVAGVFTALNTRLEQGLEFTPALVRGKPVPALVTSLLGMDMSYDVSVKDGKVSLARSALAQWNEMVGAGEKPSGQ